MQRRCMTDFDDFDIKRSCYDLFKTLTTSNLFAFLYLFLLFLQFGDSQQLRLVRILRSTVMVRVGGGWMALDEFLVKNDPCRAKGRTNIELRERFILADGVSQSMASFGRSKRSRSPSESSTGSTSARSLTGPILKVRFRNLQFHDFVYTWCYNVESQEQGFHIFLHIYFAFPCIICSAY